MECTTPSAGLKALKSATNAPLGCERYPTAPREIGEGVTKVSDQAPPHIELLLVLELIVVFLVFVIATFGGLTGSGYAQTRNTSQHSRVFVLLRRIACLFMIY